MKKIFLSGPIRGIPREESINWRNEATKILKDDFTVVHALRGREDTETMPDSRLAIIRDKTDIDSSDIILVNDSFPNSGMIGTSMEVIYAYERNKVIIVFGNSHEKDYWLDYHSHVRVDNLDKACELLKLFFK